MLRFLSNVLLARILFPEAFGLMVLVQVVISGLEMLSTVGLHAIVMQNPRGDRPEFLSTVWTIQALRGVGLWLIAWVSAPWVAEFYDQPILQDILPVATIALVINGLLPSRVLAVQRNMQLGRHAMLMLTAQAITLIAVVLIALWLQSVWALVIGHLIYPTLLLVLFNRYLPGHRDQFLFDRQSLQDIFQMGKFLIFSTMASYVLLQGDRLILGRLIPVDLLGLYGIGLALTTVPTILSGKITEAVLFPLYRMRPPSASAENQAKIFKLRRLVIGTTVTLLTGLAVLGPWVVALIYDDRYLLAGPITVLLTTASVSQVIAFGTMNVALIQGDPLRFTTMTILYAVCQITLLFVAVPQFGVIGAALAIGLTPLLTYPVQARFLHRYGNWDAKGDLGLFVLGYTGTGLACWLHWDGLALLLP